MSHRSIAIPPPPARPRRLPEIRFTPIARAEVRERSSELREACLVGGFALAFCWLAAELAIAFGAG